MLLSQWLPAVAMMALIFWLSSHPTLPGPGDKNLDFLLKKLGHVVAYGALALFYLRGVRLARRPFLLAFLLTVLFAAGDEFHQSLVPPRTPSLRDVVIDASAAAALLWATRRALAGRLERLRGAIRVATGLKEND